MARYCIGDIHGCHKTLNSLLFDVIPIEEGDEVYFVGDYIDRGLNSREVIDLIFSLETNKVKIHPLLGNHEEMLLKAIDNSSYFNNWIRNGGISTLNSFGISIPNELETKYKEFFYNLEFYYETENYIITHAGLNCNIENPFADRNSMLWTRDNYVDLRKTNGKRVISGHTPKSLSVIKESLNESKIYLDGGCIYQHINPLLGYLCGFNLDSQKLYTQINIE